MAKKKKAPKKICIAKEDRYPRGIVREVIAYLKLFMPVTLAIRLLCILFVVFGMKNSRIAFLVGCHSKTVGTVRRRMEEESVGEMMVIAKGGGPKPKVSGDVKTQIVEKVKKGTYCCLRQIADMVKISFGLVISESTVSRILKEFNLRKLKCGSLPFKADAEKQHAFYVDVLHPLMNKSENKECQLLFLDAAHFVQGNDHLGGFYGIVRKFVRTFSGRNRYNVLGALNFCTKAVHTVTNDTYITSRQVCRMLVRLSKAYKGQSVHVILDNAAYQRCNLVQMVAAKLNITLHYIPAYSPNLNLIERFWKYVKGELRRSFYDDFGAFCSRIDEIIANAKVDTLITEKVQFFDDLKEISKYISEQNERIKTPEKGEKQAA